LRPADTRRVEVAAEDTPAGIRAAAEDSQAEVDSPVVAEAGSRGVAGDSPAVADNRAAGVDSSRPVEAGNREVVADSPAAAGIPAVEDSQAEVDSRVVAAGSQAAAEDSQAAAADNNRPAAAHHRKSYRTWRKKYCPALPGFRNWDKRSAAVCRTHYRISVRERCWRRIWGILSIAAYHLSVTSITIHRENVFPADYV